MYLQGSSTIQFKLLHIYTYYYSIRSMNLVLIFRNCLLYRVFTIVFTRCSKKCLPIKWLAPWMTPLHSESTTEALAQHDFGAWYGSGQLKSILSLT